MRYKLVIFDFDGTLADTFPWFASVINVIADKFKVKKIDSSDLEKIRGFHANKILKYLDVPLWKMPLIENQLRVRMAEDIQQIRIFTGIENLLKNLAGRGVILAIVTSNSYKNVYQVLGPENAAFINYYECGVSLFGKRAKIRKILRKSGIKPSDTIYIGDEMRDGEAAQKANIAFGAVTWGYNTEESLQTYSPQELFGSVDEITPKIF